METRLKQRRIESFRQLCRERGVPFTAPRRTILEVLCDLETHPTADEVHAVVARRLEGTSRATVYRNLERLVRMGAISKVCHPGAAVRYDAITEMHHHLVCLRCNSILDIVDPRLADLPLPDTSKLGFRISDYRVQIRGLCRRCRQLEEKR